MLKLALFPVLLAAGCVISGVYGALHDQISYSVSPDYFHHLKFRQFDIPHLHNRLGAALVGWHATWWMGLFIGIPVLTVGLIMPDARTYTTRCLASFAVVAVTALAVGLGGLAWACQNITAPADVPWGPPNGVTDKVAFERVGVMHNFSYLGVFTASAYLVVARLRLSKPAGTTGATGDLSREKMG
jgi:hypothetical protein